MRVQIFGGSGWWGGGGRKEGEHARDAAQTTGPAQRAQRESDTWFLRQLLATPCHRPLPPPHTKTPTHVLTCGANYIWVKGTWLAGFRSTWGEGGGGGEQAGWGQEQKAVVTRGRGGGQSSTWHVMAKGSPARAAGFGPRAEKLRGWRLRPVGGAGGGASACGPAAARRTQLAAAPATLLGQHFLMKILVTASEAQGCGGGRVGAKAHRPPTELVLPAAATHPPVALQSVGSASQKETSAVEVNFILKEPAAWHGAVVGRVGPAACSSRAAPPPPL